MIHTPDLFIMWSFILLYTLFKTNSLKTSITTTSMVITVSMVGVLHRFDFLLVGLFLLMTVLSILVWRVIPHDNADSWSK